MAALRFLEDHKLGIYRRKRPRSSEFCSTLLQSRANRTPSSQESKSDCSTSDAEYPSDLLHGRPVQLMLKQGALTGAALAQDSTDVNRGDVHSKIALTLHKRLCEPFPPQFIAEQIQRNGIDPRAHLALTTKLMQAFPSSNPRCL